MNIKNAKRWAKALRSGKFKQARRQMHDETTDELCCLGVAYHCLVGDKSQIFRTNFDPYGQVARALDIDDLDPFMVLNDCKGRSFRQIAAVVDKRIARATANRGTVK